MVTLIGYSTYGHEFFRSPSPPIRQIVKSEFKGAIFDEVHAKEATDNNAPTFTKEDWQFTTKLLAHFKNDLEAGNIQNNALVIEKFIIKRRRASELNSIVIGYEKFVNNSEISFTDYSQPNDDLIYSVSPMTSELEGEPHEVMVESDFVGWWIVDKDTNNVLGFDKYLGGGEPDVETALTQGRTLIETLSQFPQVYYDDRNYHTFSLTTAIIPSEFERSGKKFEDVLNLFAKSHKAFIVKSSDGRLFICDMSSPKFSSPMNTWRKRDYGTLTLDFVEVQAYEEYMQDYLARVNN